MSIKFPPLTMGHLGQSPVAWAVASWPVAGPSVGQVRQQVSLTGGGGKQGQNYLYSELLTIFNSINSTFGKGYSEKGSPFPEGPGHAP